MQQIAPALQAGKQRLPRPERRQQGRNRRLQRREEIRQVRKRLDPQQLLRPDEPQHDHQAGREQQPHQHQNVARPPRWKRVHQHERRPGSSRDGNDRERHDRQQRGDVEHGARTFRAAHTDQHRHQKDHHHPRCLHDRAQEARVEQAPRRNRRHQQQPQIVGQKKRRQRGDDAAESEEGEKRQKQPRQPHAEEEVTELRVILEVAGQPERSLIQRTDDEHADAAKQQAAHPVATLPPLRAIARRPEVRQQEVGVRLHHHTISSISCSAPPPVSFRNTAVS